MFHFPGSKSGHYGFGARDSVEIVDAAATEPVAIIAEIECRAAISHTIQNKRMSDEMRELKTLHGQIKHDKKATKNNLVM